MIRYIAIKNNCEPDYDICACEVQGDVMEILLTAPHVTPAIERVRSLVALLNSSDVDPVHMQDIIEDELYAFSE